MKFHASVKIMPLPEILDPQGKAVLLGLENLGIEQVEDVRVGKHVHLEIEANDESEASQKIEMACKKLLANPIMEGFSFELKAVESKAI